MTTYLKTVQSILSDQTGIDEIHIGLKTTLDQDLGIDSLDLVELLMAFEREYDIDIADEEAEKCKTVADIVSYLEKAEFEK